MRVSTIKLRKAYVNAVGSLFCQGCGVDLLRLASALKALPVDERQQLLRQRVPHLEQWAGKWTRAICEPTEGHLWEADHIREVRHGGRAMRPGLLLASSEHISRRFSLCPSFVSSFYPCLSHTNTICGEKRAGRVLI